MVLILVGINGIGFALWLYHCWVLDRVKGLAIKAPFKTRPIMPSKRPSEKALSKGFYRIYKFIHLQCAVGTRSEDIYKQIYRVAANKAIEKPLLEMAVIVSQSHDVERGIGHLKTYFKHDAGEMFIGILENMQSVKFSNQAFERLDHLLFQKYLAGIRVETQKIKRMYFSVILILTVVTTLMLLIPLIDQMLFSAKQIFY